MAKLVMNPDLQTKLQQEFDNLVGDKGVTDAHMVNLPYLQSALKETLRIHPPGPLLSWASLSTSDVQLSNNMLIPAQTTAMVNMWAITHDPMVITNTNDTRNKSSTSLTDTEGIIKVVEPWKIIRKFECTQKLKTLLHRLTKLLQLLAFMSYIVSLPKNAAHDVIQVIQGSCLKVFSQEHSSILGLFVYDALQQIWWYTLADAQIHGLRCVWVQRDGRKQSPKEPLVSAIWSKSDGSAEHDPFCRLFNRTVREMGRGENLYGNVWIRRNNYW
ncbi:hypothetical protein NE237_000312 [Protea cynaroides]|uniref:Cytochrome P450 n=1 Tax=Protea cynaroides TaxID=273540 RepID=A0A9Q0KR68_9MAGN|nr:hypothetical protein NE237_000312 [Protea cynaroides]